MSGDRGLLCCARMMTGHSSGWLEKTPDSDVAEDSFATGFRRVCGMVARDRRRAGCRRLEQSVLSEGAR